MKTETVHNLTLPKIGFGTARLGGLILPFRWREAFYLSALRSAIELGYTHFDTAELYALGYAEELIGRALRESGMKRESVFIASKVFSNHLRYRSVLRACERSLRRLGMDTIDLYLIHWPNPTVPLAETFRALNQLVREGKIRHIGVSNFNVTQLKEAQSLSETPILTDQVPYSIRERAYVRNGLVEYCQKNNILVTAYTPIGHRRLPASPALRSIAEAHHVTPHQLALAWLVQQSRVVTIPMSFNPRHQKENLAAADIELSKSEMEQLDRLA
ncbi:MAG: aldo/keto reductase [Chloroflexota bacterium]